MASAMARRFVSSPAAGGLEPHPGGHIHETWIGSTIVLQRLNDRIFPDPLVMMGTVMRVAAHFGLPEVLTTHDGALLAYDEDCRPWRAFARVPGASSHDVVESAAAAGEVGRAFGRFFAAVQRLRGGRLLEAIPGFKDFRRRKEDFEFVVGLDPYDRAGGCRSEIEGVRHHHKLLRSLDTALDAGYLLERVVHNDAKAANVLLDDRSGAAVCVIDLDTVAPGLVLFDVGDLLRSTAVALAEDAARPARSTPTARPVEVRDDVLRAALGGFLSEAGPQLTADERRQLPLAGPLMAYENAMRFLTDHLAGDSYFRITRPGQNLDRARTQLAVLGALDDASERVADIVARTDA